MRISRPPSPTTAKWFLLKLKVQLYQLEMFQGSVCVMTNTPRRTHHLTPTSYAITAKKKGSLWGFFRTSELNTWAELPSQPPLCRTDRSLQRPASHLPKYSQEISKGQNEPKWCCWCKVIYFRTSSGHAHSAPSWIFTQGILTEVPSVLQTGGKGSSRTDPS